MINECLSWNKMYHETKNHIHTESTSILLLKKIFFFMVAHGWVFVGIHSMAKLVKDALSSLHWFVTICANWLIVIVFVCFGQIWRRRWWKIKHRAETLWSRSKAKAQEKIQVSERRTQTFYLLLVSNNHQLHWFPPQVIVNWSIMGK